MKQRLMNINGELFSVAHKKTVYGEICMSEGLGEKMTHSNTTIFHKGIFYSVHTSDYTNIVERPEYHTAKIVLTRKSMCDMFGRCDSIDVVECGKAIGDFVQNVGRSPYDPNMYIDSEGIAWLFFTGVDANAENQETFMIRKYNTKTNTLSDDVIKCKLGGSVMTASVMNQSHNAVKSGANGSAFNISCSIIKASDGYYYTGIGANDSWNGMIIRSLNLIDWERVAVSPVTNGYTWELELAEIEAGKLCVAMRCANNSMFGGYNISTGTWNTPSVISNSIAARPHLFFHKNTLYLMVNVSGGKTTADYGYAERCTAGIYKVQSNSISGITLLKKIINPFGLHYFKTTHAYDNELYVAYSTDMRRLDASQTRSNVSMERLFVE